jgi:hypothetical protein
MANEDNELVYFLILERINWPCQVEDPFGIWKNQKGFILVEHPSS